MSAKDKADRDTTIAAKHGLGTTAGKVGSMAHSSHSRTMSSTTVRGAIKIAKRGEPRSVTVVD
jgi:hypothetical protein